MQNESKIERNWLEIDAQKYKYHNQLVDAFINHDDLFSDLINKQSPNQIAESIVNQERFDSTWRNILADTIHSQYQQLNRTHKPDSLTFKNIEKLRESNTITVTTGQQIHIFLGPLFVIYKALSCIQQARKLQTELPNYNVVPIFWMATEDHDFQEISSVKLYNQQFDWNIDSNGPVGRLNPKSLLPVLDEIRQRIDASEDNLAFLDICGRAYAEHSTFALASAYIFDHLFGHFGLIVINPDDKALKTKVKGLIKSDILNHACSPKIDESIQKMKEVGIKAPINTRPINHFFIDSNGRNRIEKKDDGEYQILNTTTTFTKSEIETLIEESPEKFSPNALLRPSFQQAILPNICYISGGSEMVYWLELKSLMDSQNLSYPIVNIRKSVFIIGQTILKRLSEVGLEIGDIFYEEQQFQTQVINNDNSKIQDLQNAILEIQNGLKQVEALLEDGLKINLSKSYQKSKNQLLVELQNSVNSKVENRFNEDQKLSKLLSLKNKIFGTNFIQERNDFIINNLKETNSIISHIETFDYCHPNSIGVRLA